jgi:hypothetical protein
LRIGFGGLTYFAGALSDVRLYRGALSQQEIVALARSQRRGDVHVPGQHAPAQLRHR